MNTREKAKEVLRLYNVGICKTNCIHPGWDSENACEYCLADQILSIVNQQWIDKLNEIDRIAYDDRDFVRRICDLIVENEQALKKKMEEK